MLALAVENVDLLDSSEVSIVHYFKVKVDSSCTQCHVL